MNGKNPAFYSSKFTVFKQLCSQTTGLFFAAKFNLPTTSA